jgi:dihydrofolate reductase
MGNVRFDISVSLDGCVAGPNADLENPLGIGGEQLHDWVFPLRAWRERHGMEGGEAGPESEIVEEWQGNLGATVMGRRMYSGGEGPWDDDPNAHGWWGDDPPFHHPVFVLTHHEREPLEMEGGTTFHFVTEGIDSAVARASEGAGDKDVQIGGGADCAQQALRAGLVDEMMLHVTPILLGDGVRLFDGLGPDELRLEKTGVADFPRATHISLRVLS